MRSHTQKVQVRGLGQIIHDVLAGIDPTAAMRRAEAAEKRPSTVASGSDVLGFAPLALPRPEPRSAYQLSATKSPK